MAKLLITVDVNGEAKVKQLDKAFKDVEFSSSKVSKQNVKTSKSIVGIASVSVAAVGSIYLIQKAFMATVSAGFEFSKQMEESKAGLQALALAIQDKSIPLTERLTDATKEASVVMAELQKINAKTPHTLDQTNQIYKAMFVSMKNVGASSQEIIDLTQKLSVASGAAGIQFQSLLAGVDGLATGTVLANSDLGRFLGSLGLTNAELKESTDVVKLLNETLADFKAIDTITTATSNLANEWGRLTETLTKDIFVGAKDGMNELSKLMKNMSEEDTENLRKALNGFAIAATTSILGVTKAVVFLADGFETLGARIAGAAFRIENGLILNEAESAALEKMYQKTKDNIASREAFITTLETSINTMNTSITANENTTVAVIGESEAYDILNNSVTKNTEVLGQATDAELDKIYADELAAQGLDEFGDELIRTNDLLAASVDGYNGATTAADVYANSINSLSNTLSAAERNDGDTTGVYSTFTTAPGEFVDPYSQAIFSGSGSSAGLYGFSDGGYTGNVATDQVAGAVHGQEFVVDAPTTDALGLNGSGGVFEDMSSKLDHLYEINKTLKRILGIAKNNSAILEGI